MREALSLKYICTALFTALCLTLSTVPSAHAGKGKPNVVRVSKQHMKSSRGFVNKHHRISRRGHFKRQSFRKHRRGESFAVRRDRNRHRRNRRYYYGSGYYRDYYRSEPSYRTEASPAVQPYQRPPVTPKWVHVGSADGALGSYPAEAPNAKSGAHRNCLSVKTEILVDGKPFDAFGEVCLVADGTWEFRPSEQND
jgi:hypothetical protein